jgi:cobalt-zinc-cadmium efflux system outer membrane protein
MRTARVLALCLLAAAGMAAAGPVRAQTPVTRRDAVEAALRRGARLALARTDSSAAEALRLTARALPNPALSGVYTTSLPTRHVAIDLPLDLPWQRGPRVGAADSAVASARARFAFERAGVRFEAEAVYARALAAEARARLSRRTAQDADSLLTLARLRREAGDASDLDVELAAVNAGQQANAAADDSLGSIGAVLEVQRVMGQRADSVQIVLADSLRPPPDSAAAPPAPRTLPVLAASATLGAAELGLTLEKRSVFGVPSLQLGFEHGDPGQPGMLPTIGLAFPLPLFDRRRGPVLLAQAVRDRAWAELALTQRESDADIARAVRERAAALARVRREGQLVASAERVSALALIAYREGAAALPSVLEAARSARESLARYIDDVAAALVADAALRGLTATMERP